MSLRVHNLAALTAGRSLAFALCAALLLVGGHSAWALTVDGQNAPSPAISQLIAEALNPQGGASPLIVVDERPNPLRTATQELSRLYGSQLNLNLDSQSSLASSIYFSKSLPLFEALGNRDVIGSAGLAPGLLALRGAGGEHVLAHGRAVQEKLSYSIGRLQLQSSYSDVDKDFTSLKTGANSDRAGADALAALRGMRDLQFQAKYSPTGALALSSSMRNSVNEQPGHAQTGMTVSEAAHALTYQLGGNRQLKADFQQRDEDWRGHGAINLQKLAARFDASSRLHLTYSQDQTANTRDGNTEKGLARDTTKRGIVYQLSGRTRLDVNYDSLREQWDRGGRRDATDKQVRDYALHQSFGRGTKADLVRNLTSVTSGGTTTETNTTQLHFEHQPGQRLNLAADWMDRSRSDGGTESLAQLALNTSLGAGRGKTALKALYKQHAQGLKDTQSDTQYQLGLSVAPSRLAQLTANYEALTQQGPQANHDFVRTQLGFASQVSRYGKFTADLSRETDKQVRTKADRNLRLELKPGRLSLAAGTGLSERQDQPVLATTFGDLQIKFGRALSDWAKAAGGAEPIAGALGYGFRSTPTWATFGDGALSLSYIDRNTEGAAHVTTRAVGLQTMLTRRAYVKLGLYNNPMLKKDDKLVMQESRLDLYETGLDLGHGFAALGRLIREEDLKTGKAQSAQAFALRGAVGGRRLFTFSGGVQSLDADGAAAADWQFARFNLKLGRGLADWAKASDGGLFDDNATYGYRKLPAWASFGEGGLSLQYMERAADNGSKLIASATGFQTMLGKRSYARLSLQQNPLGDKAQVIAVDRKLYEVGRRFGGKFLALARYTTEDSLGEPKSLCSSMLGIRGKLSARERMETVIVVDDVNSPGISSRTTTYGVEYAREAGKDHYFILKGTLSHGDAPGGKPSGPSVFRVDFAYNKTI